MTGTPIQNKILDFYSLAKFLNIKKLSSFQIWKRFFPSTEMNSNQIKNHVALHQLSMKRAKMLATIIVLRRLKSDNLNGKPLVIFILKSIQ